MDYESCMTPLSAPFPWFGGKRRVADIVWKRLGDVPNYVEPFFGSGAVLLMRPSEPGIETVNDIDGFVANFWRALRHDPNGVAAFADNPVNENDLHARHIWLVNQRDSLQSRLEGDPEFYDLKIAGWWVWGICSWIGSGWCSGSGPWISVNGSLVKGTTGQGISRQLPHLGNAGRGINRQLPHLGNAGQGINRKHADIASWFDSLSNRLRNVRVCSGDWSRVCGPAPTTRHGLTGMFLDPPYGHEANRDPNIYSKDCLNVAGDVLNYCVEHGDNPLLRIALCGYDGEHNILADRYGWACVHWKANGGYAHLGNGNGRINADRERLYFSPGCINQVVLF